MFFKKAKIDPYKATEAQLVKGCLDGDRLFFEAFYGRYSSKLLALCCRYSKDNDEAQDVLHEGFIKAFKNLHRFEGKGSLEGWLRKIMVNCSLENFRKNKHLYIVEELERAREKQDEATALDGISADEILKMVQSLPSGFRVVFNLYAIEGFSHKEISEKLGISIGTSKSQLSRARQALQTLIHQNDSDLYERYQSHRQEI